MLISYKGAANFVPKPEAENTLLVYFNGTKTLVPVQVELVSMKIILNVFLHQPPIQE